MPVARRKPLYGENPEQSQLPAVGTLSVPFIERGPKEPKPGILQYFEELEFSLLHTPPLGYSWEIINLHIPISVVAKTAHLVGTTFQVTVNLSLSIGSQVLFQFRQTANNSDANFANLLFSEAPPQSLVIPQGQGLSGLVTASAKVIEKEESEEEGRIIITLGGEHLESGATKRAQSSINYKFM